MINKFNVFKKKVLQFAGPEGFKKYLNINK